MGPPSIDSIELRLSAVDDTVGISFIANSNGGKRQFTFPHANNLDMLRFNPLFSTFPTEMFTSVIFEVEIFVEFMDLVLDHLVHLRHLKLRTDPESPFTNTKALGKLLQDDGNVPPPLPKLQSLSCSSITPEDIDVLKSIISDRCNYGIALQTISVPRHYEGLVSGLAQFGVTVDLI
ncbi:hypothetical protein ONZ45_g10849 [Pleurotus djamor]|nr:hypothetical protein ONZ45_g10849 [Pleurotus djamor]